MKKILLLLCTTFCLPALVPQSKASLGSLARLPAELKQHISQRLVQEGDALNIDALAKDILNLSHTSTTLRIQINNLHNMLIILNSLPRPAAIYLVEKLGQMPVIQENMLTILQSLPRAGAKLLEEALANTPAMQRTEVKEWLKGITLENGQELYDAMYADNLNLSQVVQLINNPNIDVNWKAPRGGGSVLLLASSLGNVTIARLLLEAGANINAQNTVGLSILMTAVVRNRMNMIQLLLKSGVNVNAQDKNGQTALALASIAAQPDMVRLLLSGGANPLILDNNKESAIERTRNMIELRPSKAIQYQEIIKLLEGAEKAQKEKVARK
jgi:hypothetical protein